VFTENLSNHAQLLKYINVIIISTGQHRQPQEGAKATRGIINSMHQQQQQQQQQQEKHQQE